MKCTLDSRSSRSSMRPAFSSRSHSGVCGSACSRLIVSIGIADFSMKFSTLVPLSAVSESSPRMMPDTTWMP